MTALDFFLMAALFFVVFGGWPASYQRGRRREKSRVPEQPQPICPCGHSIGEHKDLKSCLSQTRRPNYNSLGSRSGHEWVKCQCTKYYGPKAIEDFFHQGTFLPPKDAA